VIWFKKNRSEKRIIDLEAVGALERALAGAVENGDARHTGAFREHIKASRWGNREVAAGVREAGWV
jgi:hypothetical protein